MSSDTSTIFGAPSMTSYGGIVNEMYDGGGGDAEIPGENGKSPKKGAVPLIGEFFLDMEN